MSTDPNSVCAELNLAEVGQAFQTLDCTDLILYKEQVLQLGEVIDPFDMFDLVEGQVQQHELGAGVEAFDV